MKFSVTRLKLKVALIQKISNQISIMSDLQIKCHSKKWQNIDLGCWEDAGCIYLLRQSMNIFLCLCKRV